MGIKVKIDEGRFVKRFTARFEPLLAHEVKRLCDPYVPFDRGALKGSARTVGGSVWYSTPYARRKYYEHKGDWEVAEGRLTLATAMSVLLGLEAATRLVVIEIGRASCRERV